MLVSITVCSHKGRRAAAANGDFGLGLVTRAGTTGTTMMNALRAARAARTCQGARIHTRMGQGPDTHMYCLADKAGASMSYCSGGHFHGHTTPKRGQCGCEGCCTPAWASVVSAVALTTDTQAAVNRLTAARVPDCPLPEWAALAAAVAAAAPMPGPVQLTSVTPAA